MDFNTYVFLLCLIVYVALTALFTCMIVFMVKQHLRMVRGGLEDEQITLDANQIQDKKQGWVCKTLSILLCILISGIFVFSVYVGVSGDKKVKGAPVLKVVASASMSAKFEKNEYLFENDLNNQFNTFDILILHELPPEEELKLYDIVVYDIEGYMVVHRIVGIEEPNSKHPNERYFLLQGDAVQTPDRFPVKYEQMKSIYKNERIQFVGSFVFFMQSPAGIMCYILVLFAFIATPIVEKKVLKERQERYEIIRNKKVA